MEIDRLIALPYSLILNILDRVGMEGVDETAVLSLRETAKEMDQIRRFVARVHAALAVRRGGGPALDSVVVSFYYYDCFDSDIDSWLDFAAKSKVKYIALVLKHDYYGKYNLAPTIYSNSSLTALSLENCCIAPSPQAQWRSLTRLRLVWVDLPQQAIEEIASGCPLLETLDFVWCYGFDRLEMGSRSFRRLELNSSNGFEHLGEISAPYMRDLRMMLYYCSDGRDLRLRDVSSLESAYFDLTAPHWRSSSSRPAKMMPYAMELFQALRHVKKLELSEECSRIVSLMATNGWQFPQSEVEDLRLKVEDDVHSIYGVIALLLSSPYLQEMIGMMEWGK